MLYRLDTPELAAALNNARTTNDEHQALSDQTAQAANPSGDIPSRWPRGGSSHRGIRLSPFGFEGASLPSMRVRFVIVSGVFLLLASCSATSSELTDGSAITCGGQIGLTGDLAADLPGIWRLAWSGSADGGPTDYLVEFSPGGDAEMHSERYGRSEWSWSIHGNEVRMWNHEGDSHLFATTWTWAAGEWSWSAIGYGTTELSRCNAS